MKSGLTPYRHDHRDYDYHRTFGSLISPTGIPDFNVDAGLWMPSQLVPQVINQNGKTVLTLPALPYGCTDYTQTDLCIDEDNVLYNPLLLENITHANADGGTDIRTALNAARLVFNRPAYFSIRPYGILDWFDAIRVSMYSTVGDHRAASAGTPWYSEWESVNSSGILPIPQNLRAATSWHNWKIAGQKTISGVPYLIGKSWQGNLYGDGGYCYLSRELTNQIFSIGAGAFTLANPGDKTIQTVSLTIVQTIVSFIRNLFHV